MSARVVFQWVAAAALLVLLAPLLVHPQGGAVAFGPDPGLAGNVTPAVAAAGLAWLIGVPAGGFLWWRGFAPHAALFAPLLAPVLAGALGDTAALAGAARVLTQAVLLLPLTALALLLALARLDPDALAGAAANGAEPALLARRLVLPLAWPGLLLGGFLAVLLSLQASALWLPVSIQAVVVTALAAAALPWPKRRRQL